MSELLEEVSGFISDDNQKSVIVVLGENIATSLGKETIDNFGVGGAVSTAGGWYG